MTSAADHTPARLAGRPSWLITQTALHTHRLVTDGFAAADARGHHYRLLAALAESGPASQAALGRLAGIDRSDVVAAVNELADRDQVQRDPDPADRRRNIITITPAGTRQLHRLDQVLDGIQDTVLAPLSAAERRQLTHLMARLLEHHRATEH